MGAGSPDRKPTLAKTKETSLRNYVYSVRNIKMVDNYQDLNGNINHYAKIAIAKDI